MKLNKMPEQIEGVAGPDKEVVLTSEEQLEKYLQKHGDGKTVISIVLEFAGGRAEGGAVNG